MQSKDAGKHLETDEKKHKGQAFLQMMEAVQDVFDQEEERPQAHDGKNV